MVDVASIKADEVLDCKGLSCPMPTLKIKKALQKLQSGKVLEVWGTDPGTKMRFPNFVKRREVNFWEWLRNRVILNILLRKNNEEEDLKWLRILIN